ncbi:MAG: membrane protein insertion efficiency factor YidD [Acidobacteriota bacterium]
MNPAKIIRDAIVLLIEGYRRLISPALLPACRFYPSCSEYGIQAFKKYGVIQGGYLTLLRIMRCNPFSKGGFDPLE